MDRICPVCSARTVSPANHLSVMNNGDEIVRLYSCWKCSACGWMSKWRTMELLQKLGLSTEPEVVYLAELLTLKPSVLEYSGDPIQGHIHVRTIPSLLMGTAND